MARLENKVDTLRDEVTSISTHMTKLEESELPQGVVDAVLNITWPQAELGSRTWRTSDCTGC